MTNCPHGQHPFPIEDATWARCDEHGVTLIRNGPDIAEDDQAATGPGPAVCEPCLLAAIFELDGPHHCTGATTAQTIGRILTPSAPQPCPCTCQAGTDQP